MFPSHDPSRHPHRPPSHRPTNRRRTPQSRRQPSLHPSQTRHHQHMGRSTENRTPKTRRNPLETPMKPPINMKSLLSLSKLWEVSKKWDQATVTCFNHLHVESRYRIRCLQCHQLRRKDKDTITYRCRHGHRYTDSKAEEAIRGPRLLCPKCTSRILLQTQQHPLDPLPQ